MKYRKWKNGVETVYAYSPVGSSLYMGDGYDPAADRIRPGEFTFRYRNGKTVVCPVCIDWSHGGIHGLTLSMDGTKFFLQGWENGIRCFDLTSGKLLWKNRIRRTRNLLVSENSLTAVSGDRKLIAMSAETGDVTVERIGFRQVIDVTETLCMAVDRDNRCFLADKDTLETQSALPEKYRDCIIDILPADKALYALTETLSDAAPRKAVCRLRKLTLPEDTAPALWESRYTRKRWEILREIYSLAAEAIPEGENNT